MSVSTPQFNFRPQQPQNNNFGQQNNTGSNQFGQQSNSGSNQTTQFRPTGFTGTQTNTSGSTSGFQFRPIGSVGTSSSIGFNPSGNSGQANTSTAFRPTGFTGTSFQTSTSTSGFRPQGTTGFNFNSSATGNTTQNQQLNFQQQMQSNPYGLSQTNQGLSFQARPTAPNNQQQNQMYSGNAQNSQFSLTGRDPIHENEILQEFNRFLKYCSPNSYENVLASYLYNKVPSDIDSHHRAQFIHQALAQEYMMGPILNNQQQFYPVQRDIINEGQQQNPDKENIYPIQISTFQELKQRQTMLKEHSKQIIEELNKQMKQTEDMGQGFVDLFLNDAQKINSQNTKIILKYFKIIQTVNTLSLHVRDNLYRKGDKVALKKNIQVISDMIDSCLLKLLPESEDDNGKLIQNSQTVSIGKDLKLMIQGVNSKLFKKQKEVQQKLMKEELDKYEQTEEAKKLKDSLLRSIKTNNKALDVLVKQFIENKTSLQIIQNYLEMED
ncbi:UNKNOWN [Stylonychia lemnae]|uniref:Nucleoporin Nup54 alpha-helical domain-containing protein n=1 Tax=Stylonychia lemnae TaxID=5949 RepID=A0A077ZZ23_STYLE|nr:UNKNOWN [Stylonychia lemnae]|eukprot:CDW75170.1 UNKNOWN [Stylonychia lemnae]